MMLLHDSGVAGAIILMTLSQAFVALYFKPRLNLEAIFKSFFKEL